MKKEKTTVTTTSLTQSIIINRLTKIGAKWQKVGSTVTCNPPPKDTDIDYLVLKTQPEGDLNELINEFGFGAEGLLSTSSKYPESEFASYRKGNINLIVARTECFYSMFIHATNISRTLNLLEKADRIKLFQAILYKNYGDTN